MALALLAWVEAWWEEHADPEEPDAPEPLPSRRFVAGGAPREVAWDTRNGQVTVALDRLITGIDRTAPPGAVRSPRRDPANVGRISRAAVLEVQIVRTAPALGDAGALTLPPRDTLHAHGVAVLRDAGHLLTCVTAAVKEGALLREHVPQASVVLGDVEMLGPSGGAAAAALSVTVPLL